MADLFHVHQEARIRNGKYSGLAGTVTDTRQEGGKQTKVRVKVQGVSHGEAVNAEIWLKRSQVERMPHGA